MTTLEKILQEIDNAIVENMECIYDEDGVRHFCLDSEFARFIINEIIKKHLSDNDGCKKCSGCSRRKFYQIGYEDGKKEIESVSKEFLDDCKRTAEKYRKK